jgi:multiple sugar transport system substrate-binding protein
MDHCSVEQKTLSSCVRAEGFGRAARIRVIRSIRGIRQFKFGSATTTLAKRLGPWSLIGLLAACGTAEGSRDVEIRFWAMGAEGEQVAKLVPQFERENPGIRVRVQQIPWTAAHEKLLTAHVGKSTPDVAQLGNTWIPEFEALGALRALGALIAQSNVIREESFFPGIWATNVVDDTVYGIPWYVDTRVLFYRKDLLAQAGWREMPTTWADWRRAMEDVKRMVGKDRWAIFLPTNEWAQPAILGMQAGSPLLKEGGRWGAFADSAFLRGFDFYLGLYRDGLAPVYGNTDVANLFQEFERGLFVFYITGPWNIGEFGRRLPADLQDDWATAPLPGPTGAGSGLSTAGGSSLVLFRESEHPAEAWKFIEFLSRPEIQVRFYQLTGDLPPRLEAWEDTVLSRNDKALAFRQQLERVQPVPLVPEIELIMAKLIEYAEQSIRGGVPPAEAMRRLDAEVNNILEKRRWILEQRVAERAP